MKDRKYVFPSPHLVPLQERDDLTKRELFAAMEPTWPPLSWVQAEIGGHVTQIFDMKGVEFAKCLAKWRVQMADALIAELEKE